MKFSYTTLPSIEFDLICGNVVLIIECVVIVNKYFRFECSIYANRIQYVWMTIIRFNQSKTKTNEMPSRKRNNNIENRFVETHMASSYTHIYCFLFAVSLNTEHLMDFHFNYISLCCCSCYYYWCFSISVGLSWLIVDWNSLAKCISYQNHFYCYYFITYITYKLLLFFSSTINIMYIFVSIFIVFNLLNNEINVQVT